MAVATGGLVSACSSESGGGGAPAVHATPNVTWRLASSFPRSLDTIFGAAEVLSETLEKLTHGRFRVRVYPAGELVPGLQVFDAVQQGTVHMGHSASYYFIGKNPALAFDTCVPFGLNCRQQNGWVTHGGGLEVLRSVFSDFNIMNFPGGNTGVQMGGWFRREIGSVGDLRGLKMRIPGLGGRVMDRLGVTVQVLAGGEIYQALERGVIDAAEWAGPYDDEKLGFNKVAPYYYYPGWWEPGPMLTFYVNKDAWATLPKSYQDAFEAAAQVANHDMIMKYDAKNPPAFSRLVQTGTQLRAFTDDVMNAAKRESFALMEEEAAADATYSRVYSSWKQVHEEYYSWFATSERTYAMFAVSGT
jgi:TRAP-type mannitol/chloroaromatic compound transport system substrate-binding protein